MAVAALNASPDATIETTGSAQVAGAEGACEVSLPAPGECVIIPPRPVDKPLSEMVFLIVDDNRFARSVVKNALYTYGMRRAIEAPNAMRAMDILRTEKVDMILLDLEMPVLSGIEFTVLVRKGENIPMPDVPIIMISGYTTQTNIVEARNAGVHEFLAKPFSALDLYSRIRTTVQNPRPFVRSKGYTGPDRRWFNKGRVEDLDRRTFAPPKISGGIIDLSIPDGDDLPPPSSPQPAQKAAPNGAGAFQENAAPVGGYETVGELPRHLAPPVMDFTKK